ncbi:MAG TPA: hypothetical protein VGV61_01970 [Thermoanaerobaculia bacterium]|nr:hypothetical protein [Thermoanaerobaculia bacterium]
MTEGARSGHPGYDEARAAGVAALDAGRLHEARERFAAALAVARKAGEPELIDRAFCSEAAVAISLGEVDASLTGLREILVRNRDAENCALAARNIAHAYELRKEYRKSLFYARVARDRADQAGSEERLAAANNQIGNALLALGFFQEAADTYRRALAAVPLSRPGWRLVCLSNLGYCEVLEGRFAEGLRRLVAVLREARREKLQRLQMIAHIDLCYAHMELERFGSAERHGRAGLELAEWVGEVDWIKNALFLLGEVAVLGGDNGHGRDLFTDLQRRFYPGQPYLPDFLVSVDVRQLINLRA